MNKSILVHIDVSKNCLIRSVTNSADPDWAPGSAVIQQDLHCFHLSVPINLGLKTDLKET